MVVLICVSQVTKVELDLKHLSGFAVSNIELMILWIILPFNKLVFLGLKYLFYFIFLFFFTVNFAEKVFKGLNQ